MLRNSENKITTPISSSSTHPWPQNNQKLDDQKGLMASSSAHNKSMAAEKAHNNNQDPLKCPRCDSSNTKFCYYNNYSLSQPRHFCKACKRYWTRGGTLRNVPVGGGCRKNKRVKRHHSGDGANIASAASTNPTGLNPPQIDTNHVNNNPMFYNAPELNFPFSSFRVSSQGTRFDDLQPQMSNLGLGFSSSGQSFQDILSGSGNDSVLFGSSAFGHNSAMASLLASSFQQQKFTNSLKDIQGHNIPGLMPYEDSGHGNGAPDKEVKIEANGMVWNPNSNSNQNLDPSDNNSSDPSSLIWNTNNVGSWFDPSNMGSSVPSLI